jgi:hypothetical protein
LSGGGEALGKIAGFVVVNRPTLQKAEKIVKATEKQPELYPTK